MPWYIRRVDDLKAAERQAHLQRKAEEGARTGRGLVDAFPQTTQRGVGQASNEADVVRVQAPTLPAGFSGIHVFYSAASPGVLLDKLTAALASCPGTPLVTLKLKAAKVRWYGINPPPLPLPRFGNCINCNVLSRKMPLLKHKNYQPQYRKLYRGKNLHAMLCVI